MVFYFYLEIRWLRALSHLRQSARQSREAAPGPCERATGGVGGHGAVLPLSLTLRAVGSGAHRPRRLEAAAEELAHSGDEVLRGVDGWGSGAEALGEADVAAEGLLRGDTVAGAADLVLDGLTAEAAYPAAAVPFAHTRDVSRRALLH